MPKKLDRPLEIITIKLFDGDRAALQNFYPGVGYNAVIRKLVDNHVRKLREREARSGVKRNVRLDPAELADIAGSLGGDDGGTIEHQ